MRPDEFQAILRLKPFRPFRIHLSNRLLEIHDGPFLELGLKSIDRSLIVMPRRREDWPDRDRLALRFDTFRKAA